MPQFEVDSYYSQIFWLSLCFVLLWIFFSKYIIPRFKYILNKREEKISSNLEQAKKLKQEVEHIRATYNQQLIDAREEANRVFAELNKELSEKTAKELETLSSELEAKLKQATQEIEDTRLKESKKLEALLVEITSDVSKKVTGIEFSNDIIKETVSATLKEKGV